MFFVKVTVLVFLKMFFFLKFDIILLRFTQSDLFLFGTAIHYIGFLKKVLLYKHRNKFNFIKLVKLTRYYQINSSIFDKTYENI
jgi:hypothetical protein